MNKAAGKPCRASKIRDAPQGGSVPDATIRVMTIEIQYRLLKRIASDPEVTQRTLAREMGISLGKINQSLRTLVDEGAVELLNLHKTENKRASLYVLTPQGIEKKARITVDFLRRKIIEYEDLGREIRELRQEVGKTRDESG